MPIATHFYPAQYTKVSVCFMLVFVKFENLIQTEAPTDAEKLMTVTENHVFVLIKKPFSGWS